MRKPFRGICDQPCVRTLAPRHVSSCGPISIAGFSVLFSVFCLGGSCHSSVQCSFKNFSAWVGKAGRYYFEVQVPNSLTVDRNPRLMPIPVTPRASIRCRKHVTVLYHRISYYREVSPGSLIVLIGCDGLGAYKQALYRANISEYSRANRTV